MFNDKIGKEVAEAAAEVLAKSSRNDSLLPQSMQDAATNIQDDVNSAVGMDARNGIIKNTMINAAKETAFTLSPASSKEFEARAKGQI